MSERKVVRVWYLGLTSYKTALQVQEAIQKRHLEAMEDRKNCIYDTLLIAEHKPIYTGGCRDATPSQEIMSLKNLGADFTKTNRGGLLTFHGLGQLVAYPILNLKHYKMSVKWHVKNLEETVIRLCESLGLQARSVAEYPGVWIRDSKVSEIGIQASKYITTHGVFINCNIDLAWFYYINPTGTDDNKDYTSLSNELGREFTIENAIPYFLKSFASVYSCELIEIDNGFQKMILNEVYNNFIEDEDDRNNIIDQIDPNPIINKLITIHKESKLTRHVMKAKRRLQV